MSSVNRGGENKTEPVTPQVTMLRNESMDRPRPLMFQGSPSTNGITEKSQGVSFKMNPTNSKMEDASGQGSPMVGSENQKFINELDPSCFLIDFDKNKQKMQYEVPLKVGLSELINREQEPTRSKAPTLVSSDASESSDGEANTPLDKMSFGKIESASGQRKAPSSSSVPGNTRRFVEEGKLPAHPGAGRFGFRDEPRAKTTEETNYMAVCAEELRCMRQQLEKLSSRVMHAFLLIAEGLDDLNRHNETLERIANAIAPGTRVSDPDILSGTLEKDPLSELASELFEDPYNASSFGLREPPFEDSYRKDDGVNPQ